MKKHSAIIFLLYLVMQPVLAEEIIIPVGQQGASNTSLERPHTGISKDEVSTRFGEPLEKRGAVGDPPISSWVYENYTVFFEYDKVLHSVLKPTGQQVSPDL